LGAVFDQIDAPGLEGLSLTGHESSRVELLLKESCSVTKAVLIQGDSASISISTNKRYPGVLVSGLLDQKLAATRQQLAGIVFGRQQVTDLSFGAQQLTKVGAWMSCHGVFHALLHVQKIMRQLYQQAGCGGTEIHGVGRGLVGSGFLSLGRPTCGRKDLPRL
jgi:hypothetical protein